MSTGVLAAGWAQLEFSEESSVFEFMATHEPIGDVVDWGQTAGIALVCLAFVVLGRRSMQGR